MSTKRNYKSKSSYAPKRGGSGKVWVSLTAFVLTGAIVASVLGVGTAGFKDWSFSKWFGSNQEQAEPEEPKGEAIISETVSQGLSLMSTSIEPEAYAENGVEATAETAYTLTATAQPAGSLTTIDWAIAWANPSSTWANEKTVETYVTYTLSSDTTTATVSCSQAFGEPILITATSAYNTEATATCQVDYLRPVRQVKEDNATKPNPRTVSAINSVATTSVENINITFGLGTVIGDFKSIGLGVFIGNYVIDYKVNRYYDYFRRNKDLGVTILKNNELSDEINSNLTYELSNLEINSNIATAVLKIDNVKFSLEDLIEFQPYTLSGETITPTYSNFKASDYLKYAVTYASTLNFGCSYSIGMNLEYTYNETIMKTGLIVNDYYLQSPTEFPIPETTSVSINSNNLVFGV